MRVVGVLGRVHVGEPWMLTGHWEDHPHDGRQFRLTAGAPALPQTAEDLVALRSGPDFPGIGPATAARVVRADGDRLWEVLEQDPQRLEQDGHVTVRQSRRVLTAVNAYRARWRLVRFLVDHGLPLRLCGP